VSLETLGWRLAVVGFTLMTGSLVTGALWGRIVWGVPWVWQPQQIGALVTWTAVLVTFVGVDLLLPGGLHSFLWQ